MAGFNSAIRVEDESACDEGSLAPRAGHGQNPLHCSEAQPDHESGRADNDAIMRALEDAHLQLKATNAQLQATNAMLVEANALLLALATTDGLTGIANHRAFQERLSEEWQRSHRYGLSLSVILLDLDDFKSFNDSFGHIEGDHVLRATAEILKKGARETDFVARYGGEEFVVLLLQTDAQGATEAAERYRAAMEAFEWPRRKVTASFGIASLTMPEVSAQQLLEDADKALYASKEMGRNRATHSTNLPHQVRTHAV
jgi:diguanylate cyclase (GGDEF)-like protein